MSRRQRSSSQRVFISHSHKDRHAAVALQQVLEKNGAETFLDQDRIDTLDDLPARVRDGISWCSCVLLLWSPGAAASAWVQREWGLAYDLRKKIIPYVIKPAPLPAVLENLVHIPASDQQHGNALLAAFCIGSEEKSQKNLGLPVRKARRVLETDGAAFHSAVQELVRALERGNWV